MCTWRVIPDLELSFHFFSTFRVLKLSTQPIGNLCQVFMSYDQNAKAWLTIQDDISQAQATAQVTFRQTKIMKGLVFGHFSRPKKYSSMLYRSIDTIMALAYTGKYADFQIKLCNMSYQHETQFSSKARVGLKLTLSRLWGTFNCTLSRTFRISEQTLRVWSSKFQTSDQFLMVIFELSGVDYPHKHVQSF